MFYTTENGRWPYDIRFGHWTCSTAIELVLSSGHKACSLAIAHVLLAMVHVLCPYNIACAMAKEFVFLAHQTCMASRQRVGRGGTGCGSPQGRRGFGRTQALECTDRINTLSNSSPPNDLQCSGQWLFYQWPMIVTTEIDIYLFH